MNKLHWFLFPFLIGVFLYTMSLTTLAESGTIVYFYSPSCDYCNDTKPYIEQLETEGIEVIYINVLKDDNSRIMLQYEKTYDLDGNLKVPTVFAGSQVFIGKDTIIHAIDDGSLHQHAQDDLLELEEVSDWELIDSLGIVIVFIAGFFDGFNPCAIAMLLLFISLLGFSDKKDVLTGISITYIFALFISYLFIGLFLLEFLDRINALGLTTGIDIFILVLCIGLFSFNLYDYFKAKNQEYGKIKNQLPKRIQKFNKKIIKHFTKLIDSNSKWIYVLTFVLGLIISMTELLCTGQVYITILALIQSSDTPKVLSIFYLLLYNFAFVLPLIVIAVVAVKTQSALSVSNKVREHLHLIKLFTALLFLVIAIYYLSRLF